MYSTKIMPRYVLLVDSRKRDASAYPDANNYVVDFHDTFRNVESVELVHAIYEKTGSEYLVNLYIDELNNRMFSNADAITSSFTQLPLLDAINEYTAETKYESYRKFRVPLEKLTRMSIRFTDLDGQPYVMQDHLLRFEIRTCNKKSGIDPGYVEGMAEPLRPGAALLGLGATYSEKDLRSGYANKMNLYSIEQRSSAEKERLTKVYKHLLFTKFNKRQ
ncbi:hypothetical protein TetV_139 [Tetraselmis virus 1]|uniref:DUF5901 domain-containing protein n=1 Tax=Tetraselmis virus 1 TaxID=2060617 RepID=A0A2P0VMV7_9VIRU|nr:hypothetical protein QJ968_gp139 [Tetraselmis virus 1]AUF82231.1 hypothetical protein TetV_139 [Tetraselmis virus 1]